MFFEAKDTEFYCLIDDFCKEIEESFRNNILYYIKYNSSTILTLS